MIHKLKHTYVYIYLFKKNIGTVFGFNQNVYIYICVKLNRFVTIDGVILKIVDLIN